MKRTFRAGLLLSTAAVMVASAASADERPMPTRQFVLDLGIGGSVQPKYDGADNYLLYPFPIISVGRFYVPGLGQVVDGATTKRGFFFFPSFNYIGERKASDDPDLTGTNSINWALELGVGIGYRHDWLRGFVELRQGINGHHGQVGQFGLDIITNPVERVEFSFGPRVAFASEDYMDRYFGVSTTEAVASGGALTPYDPSGGFKSVGIAARASYAWTDTVSLHLQGRWDRLIGDAADSPIVNKGSEDQFSAGVGISYRFSFDVF